MNLDRRIAELEAELETLRAKKKRQERPKVRWELANVDHLEPLIAHFEAMMDRYERDEEEYDESSLNAIGMDIAATCLYGEYKLSEYLGAR